MLEKLVTPLLALVAVGLFAACGDDDETSIVGPGYDPGEGRLYPVRDVGFTTDDGILVSALLGSGPDSENDPVVILLHDVNSNKYGWLTRTSLFVELLDAGYAVLSVDLRGYGETPLPDGRDVPLIEDLEASYLDVSAALDWLATRPDLDPSRVALVGSGSGGNVAYVSMGAFPDRIKTVISISPGLWERDELAPVVVGGGIEPFDPESILYIVGEEDVTRVDDAAGTVLSHADFARSLAANTGAPSSVQVIPNSTAHGLELLAQESVMETVLRWLEEEL